MTGRRFRFTYRLRFMLICVTCMSILFAIYAHFDNAGRKQLSAVASIQKLGGSAFPTNSSVDFQQIAFPAPEGESEIITLPVVSVQQQSKMNQFGRIVFGDAMFSDFSTILVQRPLSLDLDDFQRHISDLPHLNTIYYYEKTLDQKSLDEIRNKHPNLTLEELAGSPPQMPAKTEALPGQQITN